MLRNLKSNTPFSAPRDDTARAFYGNRAKSNFYQFKRISLTVSL